MAKNPHTELCKAVLKLCKLLNVAFLWQNNTGAGLLDGRRYIKFGYPGSADLIGLSFDGRFLALECKTGEARQTFEQRVFQEEIRRLGGRYFIIRSIKDAEKVFDDIRSESEQANHAV